MTGIVLLSGRVIALLLVLTLLVQQEVSVVLPAGSAGVTDAAPLMVHLRMKIAWTSFSQVKIQQLGLLRSCFDISLTAFIFLTFFYGVGKMS